MGSRGPVPKRTEQRRRVNKPETPVVQVSSGSSAVDVPAVDAAWHKLAREWYDSLAVSGQAQFFEASDWAQARVWAHLLSVELNKDKPSAVMVAAWAGGASELLTTEGARRRLRIELDRKQAADPGEDHAMATVTDLADRLGG